MLVLVDLYRWGRRRCDENAMRREIGGPAENTDVVAVAGT